jgi:peptidoglycan/xylan/chitin deacetylase (PgdA/CDA1 family)
MMATAESSWPVGTRCAVTVTINFDAESVDLHEVERENLYGRFSYGRYGMRAGIWRLLAVLQEHGMRATVFVPGLDAENNGRALEAVLAAGHEVAARGYAFEDHSKLGAKERETLERAHEVLKKLTGRAPAGWRAPQGLLSPETLTHLTELGYAYDSSFQDDDLPYVMKCRNERRIVELPQFQFLDDSTLYASRHAHDRVLKTWCEEFNAIYEHGLYVNLTLHARGDYGSGRASRARVVDEFLRVVRRASGVSFMTCQELASSWSANHAEAEPAPA